VKMLGRWFFSESIGTSF